MFLPAQNWRLRLWTILLGWSSLALTIARSHMKIVCEGLIGYDKFQASAIGRGIGVQRAIRFDAVLMLVYFETKS
jgi:hypothetical protein